jgi:hypothetical protein
MVDRSVSPGASRRLVRELGWLCALACAGQSCAAPIASAPGPGARVDAAPRSTPASGFGDQFRVIEAEGQGLVFPLPDPAGWRLDRRERHSWVARHSRSSSELVVRAWHFDGIARPEDCEREARLWRSALPQLAPGEILEASERMLAGAYRSHVTVGVRSAPTRPPERWFGHVLGFGSDARDCLMLAFSTSAAGPDARNVLAERLAIVAGSVFERVRRLELESRVAVPRR